MAEGKNNAGIAKQLWLTEKTVETHVRSILGKLDLPPDNDTNRRVLAVVTYLRRDVDGVVDTARGPAGGAPRGSVRQRQSRRSAQVQCATQRDALHFSLRR